MDTIGICHLLPQEVYVAHGTNREEPLVLGPVPFAFPVSYSLIGGKRHLDLQPCMYLTDLLGIVVLIFISGFEAMCNEDLD